MLTCDERLIHHGVSFNNTAIHWEFASWDHLDNVTSLNQFHIDLLLTGMGQMFDKRLELERPRQRSWHYTQSTTPLAGIRACQNDHKKVIVLFEMAYFIIILFTFQLRKSTNCLITAKKKTKQTSNKTINQ